MTVSDVPSSRADGGPAPPVDGGLARDTVDAKHFAVMSMAATGPAAAIALAFPTMAPIAGPALVFTLVLVLGLTLLLSGGSSPRSASSTSSCSPGAGSPRPCGRRRSCSAPRSAWPCTLAGDVDAVAQALAAGE